MSKGRGATKRLRRCVKALVRALGTVGDLYVKSVTRCAGHVKCEGAAVNGYPTLSEFSHSYCFSSARMGNGESDLQELVRAAAATKTKDEMVKRSRSVATGRIDENEPCEFEEDVKVGSNLLLPRRSRSLAVRGLGAMKKGGKGIWFGLRR